MAKLLELLVDSQQRCFWAYQASKLPSPGALSDCGSPVSVTSEFPKPMVSPGCRTSQTADVVSLEPGCGLPKQSSKPSALRF